MVVELFETEKSYVEAMKTLVTVSVNLTLSYNPISDVIDSPQTLYQDVKQSLYFVANYIKGQGHENFQI